MDIASVYSSSHAQYLTEIGEEAKRRNMRTASGSRGDTANFSDEALALAAALSVAPDAGKGIETNRQSSAFEHNPDDNAEKEADSSARMPGNGAPSAAGSGADIDAQIAKLEAQMQQIAQQMSAVMSGPASPEEKIARSHPLQQRISGLEQQIQELTAMKLEQETRQTAQSA